MTAFNLDDEVAAARSRLAMAIAGNTSWQQTQMRKYWAQQRMARATIEIIEDVTSEFIRMHKSLATAVPILTAFEKVLNETAHLHRPVSFYPRQHGKSMYMRRPAAVEGEQ